MNVQEYIKDSVNELRNKVTWPTLKELQGSSVLVLVATFIIAIAIYLMDVGFGQLGQFIYEAIY